MIRILFIGDVVGRPGRRFLRERLGGMARDWRADVTIANLENIAGGTGVTPALLGDIFRWGLDVGTSGNHVFDKKEIMPAIDEYPRLLRPANYPPGAPGRGYTVFPLPRGQRLGVVNLCGRVYMDALDCPFRRADEILDELAGDCDAIIIDFHAEATAEKEAFARYVDGRCAAVIGTHTHVPTADETILPGGTAFITDIGMCGPVGGVIGTQLEPVLTRVVKKLPARYEVHKGPCRCDGVFLIIDKETGPALSIRRFQVFE